MKVSLNEAKNICSTVRKNFPYESPWLQVQILRRERLTNKKPLDKSVIKKLLAKQDLITDIRNQRAFYVNSPFEYFKTIIDLVHKYKVQNCAELARIAYVTSRINGIKDSYLDLAHMLVKKEKDYSQSLFPNIDKILDLMKEAEYGTYARKLDHVALSVNANYNDKYVIDPLLNESNKTSDIEKCYKEKYNDIFEIKSDENVTIINIGKENYGLPSLNNSDSKKLARLYPYLVLPENKDKILKSNSFFFNVQNLLKKKEKL